MRRAARVLACLSTALIPVPAPAFWDPGLPTLSNYGGVGLLDTRNARFLPDGYLAAAVSVKRPDDRIALTFQAFPWVEATFRYGINDAFLGGGERLYDRSFDLKFKLLEEGQYRPALAAGFQDIIGTGVYSGEYLVASKMFGPLDISAGIGWGRLASRGTFANPLRLLNDSVRKRTIDVGQGGNPTLSYFRGPDVGLFGGIEYATPIDGLKVQLEYSSDAYVLESAASGRDYGFPVNVGVSYRPLTWLDLGLSLMHGREIGVRASIWADPASEIWPVRLNPPPRFRARPDTTRNAPLGRAPGAEPDSPRSSPVTRVIDLTAEPPPTAPFAQPDIASERHDVPVQARVGAAGSASAVDGQTLQTIRGAIASQELTLLGLHADGERLQIAIENHRYRRDAEALSRAVRVLSATAAPEFSYFEITVMRQGLPMTTAVFPRSEIDALARRQSSPAELWYVSNLSPAVAPSYPLAGIFPRFGTNVYPSFRQSLFDPENPVYVQLGIGASAQLELARGLSVEGNAYLGLLDNLPRVTRQSDSVLPHVRTDAPEYLKQRYGLSSFAGSYSFKLTPETYARLSAGYLETMFAGFGGEILYRPFGRRWALGADLWRVQQRDFDVFLRLRDYRTVTGHLSFYYDVPWNDIRVGVHAGRYLAGDRGVTFEASRRFATGIEIGGWFTLTNVSAAQFGEGSFDKGIRIVIPLEWAAPFATQSIYQLDLRPIQRDGGQMLAGSKRLYALSDQSDYGALSQYWTAVFRP